MINQILIASIELYQKLISPWIGPCCRFYPSCSEFSKDAIRTYGWVKGSLLSTKRLLSCHPFHPGGYAPLSKDL